MKNSAQFFVQYYIKKHLGVLWGTSLSESDIFWKNFFRLKASMPVVVLEESAKSFLLKSNINNKSFKCYVRRAPSSDVFVFRQIFQKMEYMSLAKLIKKNNDNDAIKLIVDAGANVGYTGVFLKLFFPQAYLLAIEPDQANVDQIKLNFTENNITDTEIVLAGVWSHDCFLELKKDKSKGQEWGFYVEESPVPTSLRAIDILNLPQLSDGKLIDILKIDIEGSETKLFEDRERARSLLSITKYLAIEIHDDVADRKHIQQVLRENNFSWFEEGELTIASNEKLTQL